MESEVQLKACVCCVCRKAEFLGSSQNRIKNTNLCVLILKALKELKPEKEFYSMKQDINEFVTEHWSCLKLFNIFGRKDYKKNLLDTFNHCSTSIETGKEFGLRASFRLKEKKGSEEVVRSEGSEGGRVKSECSAMSSVHSVQPVNALKNVGSMNALNSVDYVSQMNQMSQMNLMSQMSQVGHVSFVSQMKQSSITPNPISQVEQTDQIAQITQVSQVSPVSLITQENQVSQQGSCEERSVRENFVMEYAQQLRDVQALLYNDVALMKKYNVALGEKAEEGWMEKYYVMSWLAANFGVYATQVFQTTF